MCTLSVRFDAPLGETGEGGEGVGVDVPLGQTGEGGEGVDVDVPLGQTGEGGEGVDVDVPLGQTGEGVDVDVPLGQTGEGVGVDVPLGQTEGGEGVAVDVPLGQTGEGGEGVGSQRVDARLRQLAVERRHVIIGDRTGSGGGRLLLRLRSGDAHVVDGCLRRRAVASANSTRQVRVTMITGTSIV